MASGIRPAPYTRRPAPKRKVENVALPPVEGDPIEPTVAAESALETPKTPCRSGCKTQNHASWGDCVRAAGVQIGRLS